MAAAYKNRSQYAAEPDHREKKVRLDKHDDIHLRTRPASGQWPRHCRMQELASLYEAVDGMRECADCGEFFDRCEHDSSPYPGKIHWTMIQVDGSSGALIRQPRP